MKIIKIFLFYVAFVIVQNVIISSNEENIRNKILLSFKDGPKKEIFKVYHFLYQKKYDLFTEEGISRYGIFKKNLDFINKINSENKGFTLGFTDFTDMSSDEFRSYYLSGFKEEEFNNKHFISDYTEVSKNNHADLKIDWTSKMNPPINQSMCGSCWAFAAIGCIEGNYNLKFGNSPEFSEQELVDCDLSNNGCNGGSSKRAFDYIMKKGIAYANAYPYNSGLINQRDVCKENVPRNFIVESYENCPNLKCPKTQFLGLLQKGPIVVSMDGDGRSNPTQGNSMFQHYIGGVIDMPCIKRNHAVVMTGIDRDDKGDYYIARNSWGKSWGENGNFRIRVRERDNTCFMENYALLPIVKQATNPVPPPPVPGCMKLYSECSLKGQSLEVCNNTTQFNFTYKSFDIGKYKSVRLYLSGYCKGAFYFLNKSQGCLKINSLISGTKSIVVDDEIPPSGCIWVFEENCLTGNKLELCDSVTDLKDPKYNFSNKISSLKLGSGIKSVVIYLNPNYTGSSAYITRDIYGMAGSWLDNQIESIRINK